VFGAEKPAEQPKPGEQSKLTTETTQAPDAFDQIIDFFSDKIDHLDRVEKHLTELLRDLPPEDQVPAMLEVERTADEYLQSQPSHRSPEAFSQDLMSDQSIRSLVRRSQHSGLNPQFAESPLDLILRLLPSDGHLE
jgi:hypothetical protein